MSSSADILLAKTDAELRFFVENPHYYQPELVRAAQRELNRRAASQALAPQPAAPPAAPGPPKPDLTARIAHLNDYVPATGAPLAPPPPLYYQAAAPAEELTEMEQPAKTPAPFWLRVLPLLPLAAGLAFLLGRPAAPQQTTAAREEARLSPDSLKLEEVPINVLPTADADGEITRQLAVVPAAERQQATTQQMQQYRGVSRRFWQAERPTEFLLNSLATTENAPSYTVLADHLGQLEVQWHISGNALVYTYQFPPTMADQVARMRSVASTERRILEHIKDQVTTTTPPHLTDDDRQRYTAAQELLHGIQHRLGTIEAR